MTPSTCAGKALDGARLKECGVCMPGEKMGRDGRHEQQTGTERGLCAGLRFSVVGTGENAEGEALKFAEHQTENEKEGGKTAPAAQRFPQAGIVVKDHDAGREAEQALDLLGDRFPDAVPADLPQGLIETVRRREKRWLPAFDPIEIMEYNK